MPRSPTPDGLSSESPSQTKGAEITSSNTPSPRVTRREVAQHAGVSEAVVSYTLSGAAPVAAGTAARVRAAIRELGYIPNASARALRMGSSKLIGVIVPDASNLFTFDLCRAVETVARRSGYDVLTMNSDGDHDRIRELVQTLASRSVDGILLSLVVTQEDVEVLAESGLRWAVLNPTTAVPGARGVGVELADGARLATKHLVQHGYRRIGFVGLPEDPRFEGWSRALQEAELERGPVFRSGFDRLEGYRAGRELARRHREADAVFISSDTIAHACLRALHEGGIDIPRQIAIVAFDGTAVAEYAWPALTTLKQPLDELATRALQQLLKDPTAEPGPALAALHGELIIRASCGC